MEIRINLIENIKSDTCCKSYNAHAFKLTFVKQTKNIMKKVVLTIIIFSFAIITIACQKANPVENATVNMTASLASIQQSVTLLPKEPLEEAELARILFIREEEKLAYDVYKTMFDKYGVTVFQNVPNSELSHMESMLTIIKKYDLDDPIDVNPRGIFKNSALQELYTKLIDKGNISLLSAYQVGALIEELDISDLNSSLAVTNNQDVRLVYDFLNKGSRNHLRSFFKNIKMLNGTYIPIYISQSEFDSIVNSANERFW